MLSGCHRSLNIDHLRSTAAMVPDSDTVMTSTGDCSNHVDPTGCWFNGDVMGGWLLRYVTEHENQ
ncbi:hypothetical protein HPP92_015285 [Vanilla planifolia]|uniref:Uncharacterized protein n=1 Tax=Vanilla planifolia TaxID=51239 RepID=A0A835QKW3_VANPL|nr:hypothetical protein HPP92_015285 [Vanilla planifolia]